MTERRKNGSPSDTADQPDAAGKKKAATDTPASSTAATGANADRKSKRGSSRGKPKFTISDAGADTDKTQEPPGKHAPRGVRLVVLIVAVVAIGAALSVLVWRERAAPPAVVQTGPTGDGVAAFEARIGVLERRIGSVADDPALAKLTQRVDRLGQQVGDREDLSRVEKDIDGLAAKLADLAARPAATAAAPPELTARIETLHGDVVKLTETLAAIDTRLTQLEKSLTGQEARRSATLVLATGQLGAALRGSGPFLAELDAFRRLVGDDATVTEALQPWAGRADKGIATVALLRRRFPAVLRAALQAAALPKQQGWVGETLARVTKLVTVRPTGDAASGDGAGAVLAQAKTALDDGDLGAAVAKLERLDGATAAAVADWLGDARLRLAAENGLRALHTLAIARMAADNTVR